MAHSITASWNVRDEEKFIGYSIMSCKNIADEFIVVDHGSTDNTLGIVEQCKRLLNKDIMVYHWPYDELEQGAKNLKFKKATKDWVLWLDADEVFTYEEANRIPDEICVAEDADKVGIYLMMIEFVHDFNHTCRNMLKPEIGAAGQGHRPRVFKKGINMYVDGDLNWRRSRVLINEKVHQESPELMHKTDILIYHYDRLKTNKIERYNKLLEHVMGVTNTSASVAISRYLDNPNSKYYNIARNLDGNYNFTGVQPEVFKEYNFCNLDKLARRSRM